MEVGAGRGEQGGLGNNVPNINMWDSLTFLITQIVDTCFFFFPPLRRSKSCVQDVSSFATGPRVNVMLVQLLVLSFSPLQNTIQFFPDPRK